ncbi:MAG: hypothetical protein LBH35_01000 [Treponema sp.]|jgi:hypothetical protein|nr:hypothetical protein [Treponema sp.]
MTIEELCGKLVRVVSELPASGFDAVSDDVVAELDGCASAAGTTGAHEGKKLIENLVSVLKTRKEGGSSDDSVSIRLTALDFYVKKLQSGSTEDL